MGESIRRQMTDQVFFASDKEEMSSFQIISGHTNIFHLSSLSSLFLSLFSLFFFFFFFQQHSWFYFYCIVIVDVFIYLFVLGWVFFFFFSFSM